MLTPSFARPFGGEEKLKVGIVAFSWTFSMCVCIIPTRRAGPPVVPHPLKNDVARGATVFTHSRTLFCEYGD